MCLLSNRILFDFTHFTDVKESVQKGVLDRITKKPIIQERHELEKQFNLLFDEMYVKSDIVINKMVRSLVALI